MQAKDIMTTKVVTVKPEADVRDIAKQLIANSISAVPVVSANSHLIGIVSEGDLMRRSETGTERHLPWWLALLMSPDEASRDFVKSRGRRASDIMSHPVITVAEDATLQQIADLLEKHHIKRVPVLRGDSLVGIVSRANLISGLAVQPKLEAPTVNDQATKTALQHAMSQAGVNCQYVNIVVMKGVVSLSGLAESDAQKQAARVAAETTVGVREVRNNIGIMPRSLSMLMGGE